MTSDTRSPAEIEREIEDQRSELTENLEHLQDKFSIDTLVRQVGDQFREHGGDMGRAISDQVRANPIPLALTGIGLAWLMFGSSQKPAASRETSYAGDSRAEQDYRRSREDAGRPYVAPAYRATGSHAAGTGVYDGPSWSQPDDDDDGDGIGDKLSAGAEAVRSSAAQGAAAIKDSASRGAAAVKDTATSAGTSASNIAGSSKDAVSDAAAQAKARLKAAGGRIAEGTEQLTEEGRRRVIAARQKAIALRHKASRSAHDSADAVSGFYDRQPLVAGALALAVGAALGGALPRTKTEDNLMGDQRDALFDEAERIFQEEKSKALSVAQSVKEEVKDIAAETKADLDGGAPGEKSAVEALGDKAKSVADRVADKAVKTAQDKNLGKPKV